MLGSGSLENHLILPPCNETPPSVNRFIKTIYGKLFNMSLEFDESFSKSTQGTECSPARVSSSIHILAVGQRDKSTSQGQHWLQSWEQSRVPLWSFLRVCLWLTSPRSYGSSCLGKDFSLMLMVMWYSAYYGSREVSGCNMWGKGTAVCTRYCSQIGILHSCV